jgi:tetratricopeptide (TPR) repeat protein
VRRLLWPLWACLLLFAGCRKEAADHLQRGHDARFERRYDEALGAYRRALELLERSSAPEAEVLRARVLKSAADVYYYDQGKVQEAVAVYRELIERCPEAPETLPARVVLSGLLEEMRDVRGAIDALEGAIQRNPPEVAELLYRKANLYFELGDYAQAELEAARLVQRFTTSPFVDDAMFLRGQALAMLEGRREEAQRALSELVERLPDSELVPHALFERGRLKADAGQEERAIELWVQSLARHPNPTTVQDSIARLRRRLRETESVKVGNRAAAFDRVPQAPARPHRSSDEAVGARPGEGPHSD